MSKTHYEVTFGTMLHKFFKNPTFSATLFTMTTIVLAFGYGMASGGQHGLMFPFFIHLMVAIIAYAPGVGMRFALYRRWWDRNPHGSSGSRSFLVTSIEVTLFLVVMGHGISAVQDPGVALLSGFVMTIVGTIVNVMLLIAVIAMKFRERQEKNAFIQADYTVNPTGPGTRIAPERSIDHFFNKGHYYNS